MALLLAPLLASGSCSATYCSETCDPCFETCKCHHECDHASVVGGTGSLRLESHVSTHVIGDDGTVVETFGPIVGLSVRALRPGALRAHELPETSDFVRFADAVLRVNAERLGRSDGWSVASVERFGATTAVLLERADGAPDSLAFLYERSGDLLEIVRHTVLPLRER
jgi:hypothetical protein